MWLTGRRGNGTSWRNTTELKVQTGNSTARSLPYPQRGLQGVPREGKLHVWAKHTHTHTRAPWGSLNLPSSSSCSSRTGPTVLTAKWDPVSKEPKANLMLLRSGATRGQVCLPSPQLLPFFVQASVVEMSRIAPSFLFLLNNFAYF